MAKKDDGTVETTVSVLPNNLDDILPGKDDLHTPTVPKGEGEVYTASAADGYKSLNEWIFGEGGGGAEAYKKQVELLHAEQPTIAYTDDILAKKLEEAGIDPAPLYTRSQYDEPRTVPEGHSGADEDLLSDVAYQYVQYCKEMYSKATDPADKAYWHLEAERTRANYHYSGGADGSMRITLAKQDGNSTSGAYPGGSVSQTGGEDTPEGRMRDLLDAWQSAAQAQSSASVDYAVQKAIAEYERALQDAQPKFKEQAESTALEERQAMDNSALYSELRGDKGGIGREQYSSIQNTAAGNQLAIRAAQTKLATDTARQIADLRVQGEFEKADAALEITQEYLSRLVELEKWAAQYELSQREFQAAFRQWEAEYALEMQQLQLSQDRWQAEYELEQQQLQNTQNRWQAEFDYEQYLNSLKLSGADEEDDAESATMTAAEVYRALFEEGLTDADRAAVKAYLMSIGMDKDLANAYANAYITSEFALLDWLGYGRWGEGWSSEEWAEIMDAAETNLKNHLYNAFDKNLGWITARISQEQWQELYDLLQQYSFAPFERSGE